MITRPPISTRTDTLLPHTRSSDLLGRHCVDQPRFTAGQQEMRAWLGLHVDPGMEMQEMGVDRWGHGAGVGVDAQLAVMSGAPDRCAAPLAASAPDIGKIGRASCREGGGKYG